MSIFFVKWGSGRYTMSVVTPTFIIESFFLHYYDFLSYIK